MDNNNDIDNDIDNDIENTDLPEYSDDEDYRIKMNEAIMQKISIMDDKPLKKSKKKLQNLQYENILPKISNKLKKVQKITLGTFVKETPAIFVSQRKMNKTGIQKERCFNPRAPPYLLVCDRIKSKSLDEMNFPSL